MKHPSGKPYGTVPNLGVVESTPSQENFVKSPTHGGAQPEGFPTSVCIKRSQFLLALDSTWFAWGVRQLWKVGLSGRFCVDCHLRSCGRLTFCNHLLTPLRFCHAPPRKYCSTISIFSCLVSPNGPLEFTTKSRCSSGDLGPREGQMLSFGGVRSAG